jgi:hypothetical protein
MEPEFFCDIREFDPEAFQGSRIFLPDMSGDSSGLSEPLTLRPEINWLLDRVRDVVDQDLKVKSLRKNADRWTLLFEMNGTDRKWSIPVGELALVREDPDVADKVVRKLRNFFENWLIPPSQPGFLRGS